MRIQHNIAAMNSYRNYNTNVKSVNKNLEKLSSGYKINRAGDDAAGLAISEKMRAQITGLNAAQKNVKDGISLVKTAEGAMQEIQDMLNRMDYLATQSANGTYDNEVDRANLQKEVNNLKTEINRIADSANFNGIKLMDGSLAGNGQVKGLTMSSSNAVKGKWTTAAALAASPTLVQTSGLSLSKADIGKSIDYTVTWEDANGAKQNTTVSLTFQGQGDGTVNQESGKLNKNYFLDNQGNKYMMETDGTLSKTNIQNAIIASLQNNKAFDDAFTVSKNATSTDKFDFEARKDGATGTPKILGVSATDNFVTRIDSSQDGTGDSIGTTIAGDGTVELYDGGAKKTVALDSMQYFSSSSIKLGAKSDELKDLKDKMFEIDGHKFLVVQSDFTDSKIRELGDDVTVIKASDSTLDGDKDEKEIAAQISRVTGLTAKVVTDAEANGSGMTKDTDIYFKEKLTLGGRELTLQIGDTPDKFNQMGVKIGDMHTKALGIDEIDIGDQDGAAAAIQQIKDAINSVSSVRGDLGAIQNRLDHTANNLSVMTENIQDAESTIRDTDVADEMMAYTKNNILVQSAQAMLAQANQIPQGVLQLLG